MIEAIPYLQSVSVKMIDKDMMAKNYLLRASCSEAELYTILGLAKPFLLS